MSTILGPIRLACGNCDREDHDGVVEIPTNWRNVSCVQSLEESMKPVEMNLPLLVGGCDPAQSVFDWFTHIGTCPDCAAEEDRAWARIEARRKSEKRRR